MTSKYYEVIVGLPEAETGEEINERSNFTGMRRAILRGQRDSALIASCLRQAEYAGLSGEDTYVLLAYHALIQLEKAHRQNMEWLRSSPSLPPLLKETP